MTTTNSNLQQTQIAVGHVTTPVRERNLRLLIQPLATIPLGELVITGVGGHA